MSNTVIKDYSPSSSINSISLKGIGYRGPLQHLKLADNHKPFTLVKDPEFLFAIGAIVGLGALIIFRCIIHRSSIQAKTDYEIFKERNPILGHPEWICLSNQLVNKYGCDRYLKYKTVKILEALDFIEIFPDLDNNGDKRKGRSPIVRLSKGVLQYKNILTKVPGERLRKELRDLVKRLRILLNEPGGINAEES